MATPRKAKPTAKRPTTRTTARRTPRKTAVRPLTWQQQLRVFWSAYKRNMWSRFFTLWAASYLILMSSFFINFLKANNYIEIFPREMLFPTLMHAVSALVITLVIFWLPWLKSFAAKLVVATVLALNLIGYDSDFVGVADLIKAFVPGASANDPMVITSVLFLLILLGLSVLLGIGYERLRRRFTRLKPQNIQLALGVLIVWLFAVPAFSVAQIMTVLMRESSVTPPLFEKPQNSVAPTDKPDIYYFVFDRYTNNTVMKSQFGFDNSEFTNYLRANQYTVNDDAYANYPYTAFSVASTLNGTYLNKAVEPFKNQTVQSRTLFHNYVQQSAVVKALKEVGYKYYVVGSWYGTSNVAPLADRDLMWENLLTIFGNTQELRGIEASEFKQSPYYRFFKMEQLSWWPLKLDERAEPDSVIAELNTTEDVITKEASGGRLIFVHILLPHEPHAFNADGSLAVSTNADNVGKPVKQKYVGSVQFANSQIIKTVEQIKKYSGENAVVIFNADEGPYPEYFYNTTFKSAFSTTNDAGDKLVTESTDTWPLDWFKMKYGILQAAHIPRATPDDLAHLNSANIFRIVLNRYAGYQLPYLPVCHFGLPYTSLKEYNVSDATAKFIPQPAADCKAYETLP
jgi:hypothetical protein